MRARPAGSAPRDAPLTGPGPSRLGLGSARPAAVGHCARARRGGRPRIRTRPAHTGTRGNEGDLGARRQPADCLSSPSTAADMGSEDDNNRVTRIMFEHGQDEPVIHSRMLQMIEREVSPMQTLLLEKLCNFLLSETLTRNFAVCSALSPPSI